MNPEEIAVYKLLVSIQHLIEQNNDYANEYTCFRHIYAETNHGLDLLMKNVGKRTLTESDFMINGCDHI
jgi:hypothetical protein